VNYALIAEYSQIASAALFVLVMIWIWLKFIQPAVITAQQNANARLAEAERHRDEAKAALERLQGAVDAAQRDANAIRERAAAQGIAEHAQTVQEAREAGERAIRNAEGELGRARAAARAKYRVELLDRALVVAREQASARVDESMNNRLVSRFVSTLENRGNR
jgi:F-type H+-transporting ATPase subunit b